MLTRIDDRQAQEQLIKSVESGEGFCVLWQYNSVGNGGDTDC